MQITATLDDGTATLTLTTLSSTSRLDVKGQRHRRCRPHPARRVASRVERLRSQLSATRFRQEVMCEFLSDGLSYFDLATIENATSTTEGAVCPRI